MLSPTHLPNFLKLVLQGGPDDVVDGALHMQVVHRHRGGLQARNNIVLYVSISQVVGSKQLQIKSDWAAAADLPDPVGSVFCLNHGAGRPAVLGKHHCLSHLQDDQNSRSACCHAWVPSQLFWGQRADSYPVQACPQHNRVMCRKDLVLHCPHPPPRTDAQVWRPLTCGSPSASAPCRQR